MQDTPAHLGGHFGVTHVDEAVLDAIIERFHVSSMIDIGCGPGGMVRLAQQRGLRAVGVDGDPQVRGFLNLPPSAFLIHDFQSGPLELDASFDLAWSVEFLEHVEEQFQVNYMTAFRLARYVFCTAAPEGKYGHHHVNCRSLAYWQEIFRSHGFVFDEPTSLFLRRVSALPREFIRETGMFFRRDPGAPVLHIAR
jgi:SAM-dependent methyltransferase